MRKEDIQELWNKITYSNIGEFEYKLLSKESIPSLNIGYDLQNRKCLILELPIHINIKFQETHKENISLKFFSKDNCLCILLNDNYFDDLFDDLILSIYSKIFLIANSNEYSQVFVKLFFKWSAFFENRNSDLLSRDQIKGLFGELVFLKNELLGTELNINEILLSWRGPYDEGHDFIFEYKNYEIKTIESGKNSVRISSEFQLESEAGKDLELVIVTIIDDIIDGNSLKDISDAIKTITWEKMGDNSIFLSALSQKGLDINTLSVYDNYKFTPLEQTYYDVNMDGFPKLIRSNIPEQIIEVNFKIRLSLIDNFITQKVKLNGG